MRGGSLLRVASVTGEAGGEAAGQLQAAVHRAGVSVPGASAAPPRPSGGRPRARGLHRRVELQLELGRGRHLGHLGAPAWRGAAGGAAAGTLQLKVSL